MGSKREIPKIDLEAHFYDDVSFEGLAAHEGRGFPYYTKEDMVLHWADEVELKMAKFMKEFLDYFEYRLPEMDELNIVKQVVSLGPGPDALPADIAVDLCRKSNDKVAAACKESGGRLLGAATLPMSDPDAAVEELKRCVGEYGFVMVQGHSNYGPDRYPDQERYWKIWQTVADLGIFVYLHPTVTLQPMFLDYGYPMANSAMGFTIDAMGATMRLMLSGIFDEIPDFKIVLGHYGEALTFLMDRMDQRFRILPSASKMKNKRVPSEYFGKNILVTTSGNMSIPAFENARAKIGTDNIMLGTDYPYESMTESIEFLDSCPMSREDLEKIYYKNAARLGISL